MSHINYLKKVLLSKTKAKALKQLKALKDEGLLDNRLYHYFKPTELPAPRFYGNTQARSFYMSDCFI